MTDYGHPITFGLSLYPSVDQLSETRKLAKAADTAGLDYLAIQDHAYNPEFLDVWTLITYLAAETERISFFPDVADLQLRERRDHRPEDERVEAKVDRPIRQRSHP